jgi:hypothetical protein
MTNIPSERGNDPVDRAEAIDEPERREQPDAADDPSVDPADAGFPSSPELEDDNVVVTPPDADDEPGAGAG